MLSRLCAVFLAALVLLPLSLCTTNDFDLLLGADPAQLLNSSEISLNRRQTSSPPATYYCSSSQPCSNGACCGSTGVCGYGPTYCTDGCQSNCNATAPCGRYASTPGQTCPLNVCCSQFGFCGTTEDFCGTGCQSNCGGPARPSGAGDVRDLIIGYYEGWNAFTSSCAHMDPSSIPVEGLDIVNLAFAYVDPVTFDVVPMDFVQAALWYLVPALKIRKPGLKVFISIGGWSMFDNGTTTQHVFSNIAGSISNTAKFAGNLLRFVTQYGFDGVDIDWEYPGAPDRGGSPADVNNFPQMLSIIRTAAASHHRVMGMSITAPTSYWYLRWFNLPKLANVVDFINLMSYDLHGIWDATDPIGPYVYAHTNLTEIDLALDLFWRNNIPPLMINLGLAFYGRSFTLSDPTCIDPGCGFSGPGIPGACTQTAGIMSYIEIESLLEQDVTPISRITDTTAAINYLVTGDDPSLWVSYDDKGTFELKINYANQIGLNGLFIWAVDMDPSFSALKAVTGKDLPETIPASDTLSDWNVGNCYITGCNEHCRLGWTQMTTLNLDAQGIGCPNSNTNWNQRSLCCEPWGTPNPGSCTWRGSPTTYFGTCNGQCNQGEVSLAETNFDAQGYWCATGTIEYCCPATNGGAAVSQCTRVYGQNPTCPSDKSQLISQYETSYPVGDTVVLLNNLICCPGEPTFNNCKWNGNGPGCQNNKCPLGQIAVWKDAQAANPVPCYFGREPVLCCDPPFGGSAFVPVELDWLFPYTLPTSDAPVYAEAFDHSPDQDGDGNGTEPAIDGTDDPERESFAWFILVGEEEDVQSLRKRDGSQLETFDCPSPDASDYSSQALKAVCMSESDDNNCEDILLGGAYGTIIRLPDDCGPDIYVRVISFKPLEEYILPDHLAKRVPTETPKVYEIRYDYNLRQLRRDAGEIYIRLDASNHPGYWDQIVNSNPVAQNDKREADMDWRAREMQRIGLVKRGFSTDPTWWTQRFSNVINTNVGSGLHKQYDFSQLIYDSSKICLPNATAQVQANLYGSISFGFDYGITLIGTLKNFDFSESFAYFNYDQLKMKAEFDLRANARLNYVSELLPLIAAYPPFGSQFNIKGLWTIGPYFSADAQFEAVATVSGFFQISTTMSTNIPMLVMFPQGIQQMPQHGDFSVSGGFPSIQVGEQADISASGAITLRVIPTLGFKIELDALGKQLVHTDIKIPLTAQLTLGIETSSSCNGPLYGAAARAIIGLEMTNALPGWQSGGQSFTFYDQSVLLKNPTCYPWDSPSKRDLLDSSSSSSEVSHGRDLESTSRNKTAVFDWTSDGANHLGELERRSPFPQPLFPDLFSSYIFCPVAQNSPTGDCFASALLPGPDDDGISTREIHVLEKRTTKVAVVCDQDSRMTYYSPYFQSSKQFINKYSIQNFKTYGPLSPGDCNDYSFGLTDTPSAAVSGDWATEHVLEWQLLGDFIETVREQSFGTPFPNPDVTVDTPRPAVSFCKYMNFWWNGPQARRVNYAPPGYSNVLSQPLNQLAGQYPGFGRGATFDNRWSSELMLLDKDTNNLKERLWGDGDIRTDDKMNGYIAQDVNVAINNCKSIMNAMKYMQISDVSSVLVTEATRIGQAFDDLESAIKTQLNDRSYSVQQYAPIGLGNLWRAWIKQRRNTANSRGLAFLNKWIPKIDAAHSDPSSDDEDTQMGNTEPEHNQAILDRITALKAAFKALPAWTDPFPSNW